MQREGRRLANAVLIGALAVAALSTARQLLAARPLVEGIDLYYYLCVARDLADGVATSETRHFYFPRRGAGARRLRQAARRPARGRRGGHAPDEPGAAAESATRMGVPRRDPGGCDAGAPDRDPRGGEGLAPLRLGLSFASGYEAQGTPWANLRWIASHAPLLAIAATLLVIAAPLALLPRWRPLLGERWAALAAFSLLAGLVALVQFSKRHYLHYALLPAPLLIVAFTLVAAALVRRLPARAAVWSEATLVVAALVGLTLAHRGEAPQPAPWRAQPDVAADLVVLKSQLRPGEDLLVIPPRRNEIHFHLGTRSQSFAPGYTWGPGRGKLEAAVRKPELDAVLVLRRRLDKTDAATWRLLECDRAMAALGPAGFRPVAKLRASTLFRRMQPSPNAHAG